MTPISAIIFDLDGLLVDSEPVQFETSRILFRRYGRQFTLTHLKKFLGVRVVEELSILKHQWQLKPTVGELLAERKEILRRLTREKMQLFPGVKELLTLIRRFHIPIGLGTSAEKWYVDEIMSKFALRPYFKTIISSADVQNGKPHPEVYLKVAAQLGISPAHCLVLEDAVTGVAAAHAAGMMCFAVPSVYTKHLDYSQADKIFTSLNKVRQHLTKTII
ncbi:MAG: HAD family phosphatase [Candidatus Chisholmbacteria bacterium]|nr:HAD family phosphatase [Candidatus Chisholmbacteria bacterium]